MLLCAYSITFSLLLLSSEAQDDQESCKSVTIDPPHLVVRYGDLAQANCSTAGHPGMIGWETPVGAVTDMNKASLLWSVDNFTHWSLTNIMCYTLQEADTQCAKTLPITLYKPPDSVSIRSLSTTVEGTELYEEGTHVHLECTVWDVAPARRVRVTWYAGAQKVQDVTFLTAVNDSQSLQNVSTTMQVILSREQHGTYRCEATLELEGLQPYPSVSSEPYQIAVMCMSLHIYIHTDTQTDRHTHARTHHELRASPDREEYVLSHLLVYGTDIQRQTLDGPEINCPKKIQVKENEKLPSCAVGNPPPKVFWTRGNNMVIQEEPLSRNQGGLYTVLAKNDAGRTANQTVDVEVLFGPEVACPKELQVTEGETLTGCTIKGNPTPVVNWYKDKLIFDPKRTLSKADSGNYSLVADSTNSSHGVYHTVYVVIISRGNDISISSSCVLLMVLLCHVFPWL
ncbi:uncharacterized protein LOC134439520 [Engraulis encrasicolus]|uniref:uncharacterized protein LOC134439520 n=1 Tax=Engraulis encrasicolus TaxID=184585 RepID=UPI002FD3E7BB